MRRLAALAALALVWVPVAVFAATRGADVAELAEIDAVVSGVDAADPQWSREDIYTGYALAGRVPNFIANDQFPAPVPANPDRVRVLVLGDSFTYGWGLTDLDRRWPVLLEQVLDERTAPGAFEVVTVATGGTSTYTHAMWLRDIAAGSLASVNHTEAQVPLLQGHFDAVIIGYVSNDISTDPRDVFEGKERFVSLDDQALYKVQIGAAPDPNEDLHRAAIESIATSAAAMGAVPMWLPLTFATEGNDPLARVRSMFAAAGFVIGSSDAALATIRSHERSSLTVNPVDTHPGPALLDDYAAAAADMLLETLPTSRVSVAQRAATPAVRPLVSNVLPDEAAVSSEPGATVVRYVPQPRRQCRSLTTAANRSARCEPDGTQVFVVDNKPVEPQYAPCALLAHPYAQVMLDPRLAAGTQITLRSATDGVLEVYRIGYDREGFTKIVPAASLRRDKTYTFESAPTARGLLLVPDTAADCATGTLLPFEVRVEVQR